MDNALRKTQAENIDVQVARAILSKLPWRSRMICMSGSDIFFDIINQIECK